jgi:hypothetical protein
MEIVTAEADQDPRPCAAGADKTCQLVPRARINWFWREKYEAANFYGQWL